MLRNHLMNYQHISFLYNNEKYIYLITNIKNKTSMKFIFGTLVRISLKVQLNHYKLSTQIRVMEIKI